MHPVELSPDAPVRKQADSAGKAIVIRQSLGDDTNVPPQSPDLIVTGASPAFDNTLFTDAEAFQWRFSQAPVFAKANYIYIRGANHSKTGKQQARVYLYYAQSDQVLDPGKWQSSGFTVGGVAQNYTPINALTEYQIVIPENPVMWTPPAPTAAGASYFLISWIDGSDTPTPPKWPSTPFATLEALAQYLQDHPQMAMLDTAYRGAFLRQFPGQSATQDGTGTQTCPDIIVTGVNAAADASSFATSSSYSATTLSNQAALGARNFVYIRAINTRNGPATARVYLYWATSGAVSPSSWEITDFTVAGNTQNWVDLSATKAGEVMVSTVPMVWEAPTVPASQSCVLAAYVDNSGTPSPPDFTDFGYVTLPAVSGFLSQQPQMAWLSIASTAAPAVTISMNVPLPVAANGPYYVGVQLQNIPTDGKLSISVPGPDAASTVVMPSVSVPATGAAVVWPVTYPANFGTSAVVTYTAGSTPLPPNHSVTALLLKGAPA
jgi:hypothetical protein